MDGNTALSTAPFRDARYAPRRLDIERREDGSLVLANPTPFATQFLTTLQALDRWSAAAPDRVWLAERAGEGWRTVTYAQGAAMIAAVAGGLKGLGLKRGDCLLILARNGVDHALVTLAAQYAGIASVSVSPAYSLVSQDFGKLRHVLATTTPGLVFASDARYAKAIAATVAEDVEVVLAGGELPGRASTPFAALLDTAPGAEVDAAHARVGPDTIVKFLFTSGSTKAPKAVINTQRMLCANLQMIRQAMAFLADEPPVLVDWLPWNHTFGGNHNIGIVLYNGGTLYIDDGKPTPQGIAATLRNLREIAPTVYFNVPKGFEEIAAAMEHDDLLRRTLFSRVQAFMYAGAGLSQAVWDQLESLAERTVGERIPMITGLGMTETAPSCTFALRRDLRAGHIGLPCPGVEVKLVPMGTGADDKVEVRFRGPNVMPGYWRAPEQTAEAFDDEGYYRTGDAVRWVDAADPQRGLLFDGRVAEDFKLSTGTFVSVGPLRARIIAAGAPCVQDAVITGLNRDDIGMLLFPRLDECRRLAGLGADAPAAQVLRHDAVRGFFQLLLDRLWREGTGSATRVARAQVLVEPPSIDRGEVTDKGSINQRAVLQHRAALVEALYDGNDPDRLLPGAGATL